MSFLMSCGVCCMCLSVWAIIQLALMGVFYKIETVVLIEDVHALKADYKNYDEFMAKTKQNYNTTALNCWICAGIYLLTLLISIQCIIRANKTASSATKRLEDDEYVCEPKKPKIPKKVMKMMQKMETQSRAPPSQPKPTKSKEKYEKT